MNKYFAAKTALIVDSNRVDLGALRDIFGQFGLASVAAASSANMASSYLQAQTFDFCIVAHDLGRGEKSGLQIVQEALLDGYRHRRTVFVLLAAAPQALQCAGLVDYAPDICLPKPLDRARTQERLEKLAQLRRVLAPIDSLLEQGRWAAAISQYEQLGERYPGLRSLLCRLRGQLLLRLGNFEAARDLFAGLIARHPQRWVSVGLGRALYGLGDYAKARQWLEREDDNAPLSPEACLPLARSLRMEGQRPAALALLRKAVLQNPAMAQLQAELGNMQGLAGDWDLATVAYRGAVRYARFSPFQCVEYYCALVRALLFQIDGLGAERSVAAETEAVQTIENLVRDFQDDPATVVRAKLMSVEVYLASGNRQMADQAARDAFSRFEALDLSEQLLLLDLLVDTLEQSCMADVAQSARREVIRQMSRLGWGRCNLSGLLSFRKGDFAAAYEQFCTADELCPSNPSIVLNLVRSGLELVRVTPDQSQSLLCRCNDALSDIHYGALGNRQRERCRSLWLRLEALYSDHSEPGFVVLDED